MIYILQPFMYRCCTGTTMSETFDSDINVTQVSEISNDLEVVNETGFDAPTPCNRNEPCKVDIKVPMDSISVSYEDKYKENSNYVMTHSPRTVVSFTPTQVSKVLKCRLVVTFIFIICTVIALYQIPITLFCTTIHPKLSDSDITDYVDFKSCSVTVSESLLYTIIIIIIALV